MPTTKSLFDEAEPSDNEASDNRHDASAVKRAADQGEGVGPSYWYATLGPHRR